MKKHIFGVALFSLIVASFAIVYAFFRTPSIPLRETVNPPVSQIVPRAEKPASCNRMRSEKISYEAIGADLYLSGGKLASSLKLKWNGVGNPPKQLYITPRLFALDQTNKSGFDVLDTTIYSYASERYKEFKTSKLLVDPFDASDEKKVFIESQIFNVSNVKEDQNLYVVFDVTEEKPDENSFNYETRLNEAKSVLLIPRPNTSIIYAK